MLWLVVEFPQGAPLMEWVTPQHEEIDRTCEVSFVRQRRALVRQARFCSARFCLS